MRRTVLALPMLLAAPAFADAPTVEAVEVVRGDGGWRFDVTVSHYDEGWAHYADGWEVIGPDGTRLGFRELLHPHVAEQPFTRSLPGVRVPEGLTEVQVRAHDSVHGWGPPVRVALPE